VLKERPKFQYFNCVATTPPGFKGYVVVSNRTFIGADASTKEGAKKGAAQELAHEAFNLTYNPPEAPQHPCKYNETILEMDGQESSDTFTERSEQ